MLRAKRKLRTVTKLRCQWLVLRIYVPAIWRKASWFGARLPLSDRCVVMRRGGFRLFNLEGMLAVPAAKFLRIVSLDVGLQPLLRGRPLSLALRAICSMKNVRLALSHAFGF